MFVIDIDLESCAIMVLGMITLWGNVCTAESAVSYCVTDLACNAKSKFANSLAHVVTSHQTNMMAFNYRSSFTAGSTPYITWDCL